ncbi:PTS sugar transporter subunit IIA [Clostridioides difficile]|nr:PTS sugar transporter subunit IIA [Clostridioides difficile]
MLKDLLTEDMIRLKVSVDNWEDAIRESAKPLVENKKIKSGYIENMINSVHKMGPYIVIMPGIAFAHARPDETVLETSLSVMTLAKPVEFGSEHNDPVDIVFSIATSSENHHLTALKELAIFLSSERNLELLKNETDKMKLINLIMNNQEE